MARGRTTAKAQVPIFGRWLTKKDAPVIQPSALSGLSIWNIKTLVNGTLLAGVSFDRGNIGRPAGYCQLNAASNGSGSE